MREAGDAAAPGRVRCERARTRAERPAVPADRARHHRVALGVRLLDAAAPLRVRLDRVREVGVRALAAREDVDRGLELLAAELGEPRAELGDEVEREPVPAGRDRRAHVGLDAAPPAGRERRDGRPLAVPDQRVAALVEPVVAEPDAVAPGGGAGVLELDAHVHPGAGVHLGEAPAVPADDERALRRHPGQAVRRFGRPAAMAG